MIENKKGQGALEYLIIIAGVLAIAALVVMFISGAGGGAQRQNLVRQCQNAATACENAKLLNENYDCTASCAVACGDPTAGYADLMDPDTTTWDEESEAIDTCDPDDDTTACGLCAQGKAGDIV